MAIFASQKRGPTWSAWRSLGQYFFLEQLEGATWPVLQGKGRELGHERKPDESTLLRVQLLLLPYFRHAHSSHFQALMLCPTVPMTVPARGYN
jgi:hypothetical protein